MDRRHFMRNSVLGVATASGGLLLGCKGSKRVSESEALEGVRMYGKRGSALFPVDVPSKQWTQFTAAGFTQNVCGVIYRRGDKVPYGMPLGGVGTGYLNIETDGRLGLSTIFNSGVPVRGPLEAPFLGLSVGGKTWVLHLADMYHMGVETAHDIHYWGHYPILDMEYELSAPVSVGLRAWAPFIPGDVLTSNIPAAVFEVHLRNSSPSRQQGTIGFNFPGPTQAEAQIAPGSVREKKDMNWLFVNQPVERGVVRAKRNEVSAGDFHGLSVRSEPGTGYVVGVIGNEDGLRFGTSLWTEAYDFLNGQSWNSIREKLPLNTEADFSTSMAVDFNLDPNESKIIRILLAWYSPGWRGEGENYFNRMYTKRYSDAVAVAEAIAKDHSSLLSRIIAWQQALYSAEEIPVWLRESLVNILHLITRTSYWAVAKPPIGEWCRDEDGLFGLNESPRDCPQIECIPCSFYGNMPLVYFFPELALSTLRGYKAYQYPNGTPPWIFGGCTGGSAKGYHATDGTDMVTPSPGYQTTMNGACYVDLVDRYWQRTGDDAVLKEFYPSLKKATIYAMSLRSGPEGIVSVPKGNVNPTEPRGKPGRGLEWFEGIAWFGMTPHVGGVHLAQLRMMQRMAEKVGDHEFLAQCQQWLKQGSEAMEDKLWTGRYYLAYYEPETGKKSDLVFAFQLDGDWMCFYHGLPGVFQRDRALTTLQTIKRTCMALTPFGAVNLANPNATAANSAKFMAADWGFNYGSLGYFIQEVYMLAATFMYMGQREVGLELARKCTEVIITDGYVWTQPHIFDGRTGKPVYGSDYYFNMVMWALPAAIKAEDISKACGAGSLVDKIIRAGKRV